MKLHLLLAICITCLPFVAAAQDKDKPLAKTGISFKMIPGSENGTLAILDKRKAEVTEKKGGTLSGHDWWLWGLTAIDYDRDGDPDLMVTIHGPAGHGVFLKNQFKETGKLTFTNVTQELGVDWQLPSAEGRRTFVWDFDGDGFLDFSGLHTPDFLNQEGKKFVPIGKKTFGSFNPQAIVDLNGDGYPDVFNTYDHNAYWNPKTKIFDSKPFTDPLKEQVPESVQKLWKDTKEKPTNRFLRVYCIVDHDLDGDGTPETVVTGYGSYGGDTFGRYLKKDKDGKFTDATKQFGLPENGTPILYRDLDGDGHLDLLLAAHAEGGFFRNDGKGSFKLQPGALTDQLKTRDPYLHRADAVDFDHDGLLDLVISKPRGGPKVIYANLGDGKFEPLHKMKGWDSDPVVVCDLNDDGLLDVAIGGDNNNVTLYINTASQPGNGCLLYPRLPAPNVNAVGAKIEAFRVGTLGKTDARPFLIEKAHPDATPIHIGLGQEKQLDLRITFPGKDPVEVKNVTAVGRMQVGLDGKLTAIK